MIAPTTAYDLLLLDEPANEAGLRADGWRFGLPPGIRPEQWPLDTANGYPLKHGFTLLLPPEYRCHGPDLVAVSFFGAAPDHCDGAPVANNAVEQTMLADKPPEDPDLLPFWQAMQTQHPRLHRMLDILYCNFATILLTQEEFDAPFCRPPAPIDSPHLAGVAPPEWLKNNATATFPGSNRALRLLPRAQDPNAGKAPGESWDGAPTESGYQPFFYWQDGKVEATNYRLHDWAKGHASDHLGGTMRPIQGIPGNFSPYYIGFEEHLGGFNFGSGNAQLDILNMKLDWACG